MDVDPLKFPSGNADNAYRQAVIRMLEVIFAICALAPRLVLNMASFSSRYNMGSKNSGYIF